MNAELLCEVSLFSFQLKPSLLYSLLFSSASSFSRLDRVRLDKARVGHSNEQPDEGNKEKRRAISWRRDEEDESNTHLANSSSKGSRKTSVSDSNCDVLLEVSLSWWSSTEIPPWRFGRSRDSENRCRTCYSNRTALWSHRLVWFGERRWLEFLDHRGERKREKKWLPLITIGSTIGYSTSGNSIMSSSSALLIGFDVCGCLLNNLLLPFFGWLTMCSWNELDDWPAALLLDGTGHWTFSFRLADDEAVRWLSQFSQLILIATPLTEQSFWDS